MVDINLPGFIMTVVGTAVIPFNIWFFLFPRFVVLSVSRHLLEVSSLLDRGLPLPNEVQFRTDLENLKNRFCLLRTESNRSPGFLQQLARMVSGLTYRLFVLRWDIDTFKRKVELEIDAQQLAIELVVLNAAQHVEVTVLPAPTTNTAAPANNVAEPPMPPTVTP